ncbi:MAG: hypothetical protein ACK4M7_03055 [Burkholderiales bacterium]
MLHHKKLKQKLSKRFSYNKMLAKATVSAKGSKKQVPQKQAQSEVELEKIWLTQFEEKGF